VSLAFLEILPKGELLPLLEKRHQTVQAALQKLTESEKHQGDFKMVFTHQRRHFETELALIDEFIANI